MKAVYGFAVVALCLTTLSVDSGHIRILYLAFGGIDILLFIFIVESVLGIINSRHEVSGDE